MEEAVLARLRARKGKLFKTSQETKEAIELSNTVGVDVKSVCKLQHMLSNDVDRLRIELQSYINLGTNISQELITDVTQMEMEAEDLQAELVALEKSVNWRGNSSSSTKLPKLVLPMFNGDILQWYQFWDRFETTIHKSNLSDADKLAYLMGSLEGPAQDKLTGISTTNLNYNIAVDLLKERYGSKIKLIDNHYSALYKIKRSTSSAAECRRTLDEIEKHRRLLKELGEDIDGNHLRTTIIGKFPDNIMYQVNLLMASDERTTDLIKNIELTISALEKSETKSLEAESGTTSALHIVQRKSKSTHRRREEHKPETSGSAKRKTYPNQGKRKSSAVWTSGPAQKKTKVSCIFCEGSHYNDTCDKIKSLNDRKGKLVGRCFNCFRKGHDAKDCRLKKRCVYCQRNHNRALCPDKFAVATVTGNNNPCNVSEDSAKSSCFASNSSTGSSFLQTATVTIPTNNRSQQCRLLLDCGSQRSYITTRIARQLNLVPDKEDLLLIYTFGSDEPNETCSPSVEINFTTKRGLNRKIRANIVAHITDRLPVPNVTMPDYVDVAADDDSVGERIDILIGNDYYFSFIGNKYACLQDNLYLIDTDFGWIISGSTAINKSDNILSVVTYCQCHNTGCPYFTEPDLPLRNVDMKFLWNLESIGITDSPKASQQEEAVKHFNNTVEYKNGRYFVKWPWVQCPPEIPTNFGLAYGRLKSLLRRLDKDTLRDYEEILKEQLDAGIIEYVNTEELEARQPVHYLPHHIVKQEGKRGRIVYDASAKIKDSKSLNEAMLKGPSMLEDLTGLLLKFRTGEIGISGDVEKAFLQVGLQDEDRDVTRFLWVKEPHKELTEDNLLHLRFTRVPFGIISSPFLLTATIRYHLARNSEELLKKIADRCYVDNLVTSSESVPEAVALYKETRKVFGEISMNIRDWVSNSQEFMNTISEEQRSKQKDTIKILGLTWNLADDTLQLKVNEEVFKKNHNVTKRDVLKTLARVYDPCGYAAPLVLPAKLLFQELCNQKVKWDSKVPEKMLKTWDNACDSLHIAKNIKIPRYAGLTGARKDEAVYDLHCYTDASKNSYAAVVYLVTYHQENTNVAFIMSKARITPAEDKDDLKIPRLELLGYLIGSRLLKYVKKSLQLNIANQCLWSDSIIVLSWMRSNKLLPPFVLRRVNEIKENLEVEHCYINTNSNPADLATRPELWNQKKDLWFNGPNFLKENKCCWPKTMYMQVSEQATCLSAGEALDVVDGPEMVIKGYEDSTTMTLQDSEYDTYEANEPTEENSLDETAPAIKRLQAHHFPDEVNGKETHLTRNLGLFLDGDGVLRCRGRMMNTSWPYEQKYPALIPRESTFTHELIKHTHEENYHVGVSHTLSLIRQRYWIPQGRAQVQKIIKKCPQCVRHGGGPYKLPPPPALPIERVNFSAPFTYTGVDYFGPLLVTTASGKEKRWVCLFTCLAVRAIHLEVVENLTAEECLSALRRFIASRGLPHKIVSDNSQTFKLTSEVLSSPYCIQNKILWKFIPQLAPWHGGFYERLVALVKHCLKRTIEKHLLHDNQLKTIIKEVEAVVNTRPLTYIGADLESVLRPADFLTLGKCLTVEATEEEILLGTNIKIDLVKSWKRGLKIIEEFKSMFTNQYLFNLRERYNHSFKQHRTTSNKAPKIGDFVQIKDGSKNRINWKVGKIVSLLKGKDDLCRVAKVRVGDTEFTRSIAHLYPIEDDLNDTNTKKDSQSPPQAEVEDKNESVTEQNMMEVELEFGHNKSSPEVRPELPEKTNEEDVINELENLDLLDNTNEKNVVNEMDNDDLTDKTNEVDVVDELDNITLELNSPSSVEEDETGEISNEQGDEELPPSSDVRLRRGAAIRARERIAEWTRLLFAHLQ